MDRIELRRRQESGPDIRVVADIGPSETTLDVTIDGKRTGRIVPGHQMAAILARLDGATLPVAAAQPPGGSAVGYDVTFTSGMTQSAFRWVAATPVGWEPLADLASELLTLARAGAK